MTDCPKCRVTVRPVNGVCPCCGFPQECGLCGSEAKDGEPLTDDGETLTCFDEVSCKERQQFNAGYDAGAAAAFGIIGMAEAISRMEERRRFKAHLVHVLEFYGRPKLVRLP